MSYGGMCREPPEPFGQRMELYQSHPPARHPAAGRRRRPAHARGPGPCQARLRRAYGARTFPEPSGTDPKERRVHDHHDPHAQDRPDRHGRAGRARPRGLRHHLRQRRRRLRLAGGRRLLGGGEHPHHGRRVGLGVVISLLRFGLVDGRRGRQRLGHRPGRRARLRGDRRGPGEVRRRHHRRGGCQRR
ncbi:hypothetical protein MICRO80W_390005 [Micrococcus luteus]|nr:hypothetical protein MICRO80W_390005 [Micrococcus luteus]